MASFAPINYAGMIQAPDAGDSLLEGLKIGQGFQQVQLQNIAKQQAIDAKERAEKLAIEYQNDISRAMANPSPKVFAELGIKYPQQREAFKQSWDQLNTEQQQSELKDAQSVGAALSSGATDVAKQLLTRRIEAVKNSGGDASAFELINSQIDQDPKRAYGSLMHIVSALPGGDKVLENLGKLGTETRAQAMQPLAERKATAEATTAEVAAKFAEREKLADLEAKGWNIQNIRSMISDRKETQKIAAMNAALAREGNDMKKQELQLKLDEMKRAQDQKALDKVSEYEASSNQIQDTQQLLSGILGDESSLRAATGMLAFKGSIPGTENRAMAAQIERVQNSLAMGNLEKLKGAVSDKDIAFLKSASASLDRYQDEDKFIGELKRIKTILDRAEGSLNSKFGVPNVDRRPAADRIPGQQQNNVRAQADAILRGN